MSENSDDSSRISSRTVDDERPSISFRSMKRRRAAASISAGRR
jgi:hypothetical protein